MDGAPRYDFKAIFIKVRGNGNGFFIPIQAVHFA